MKKTKDVSDEDEYSADDPDEVEASGEEDWIPDAGAEGETKKRPQRESAKKRHHSEEEEEEEEEEDEESDSEDEDLGIDYAKIWKKKRLAQKDEEEEEDSDDNTSDDSSGIPPKDWTSGAFVVAKSDVGGSTDPTLWRIDGKALLQKYLPFKEEGKTLYKSTSTYSGWSINHKDRYLAAQVTFKVQNRLETIVELHLNEEQQPEVVKVDKDD